MASSDVRSPVMGRKGMTASVLLAILTFFGAVVAVPSTDTLGDITILATDTLRRASKRYPSNFPFPHGSTNTVQPATSTVLALRSCWARHAPTKMQKLHVQH